MAMSDYSDLEKKIKDAPELKVLPKGSEVKARIIAVRSGVSEKNGCTWYSPVFDVPKEPLALEFNHFMWDLDEDKLDAKQYSRAIRSFKEFAECFGLDYTKPFDWEDDLVGLEGWVILGMNKSDEYGDQNKINKFVAPK